MDVNRKIVPALMRPQTKPCTLLGVIWELYRNLLFS